MAFMTIVLLISVALDQVCALHVVPADTLPSRRAFCAPRAAVFAVLPADEDAASSSRFALPPAAERSLEAELRVAASVERQRVTDDSAPSVEPSLLRQLEVGGQLLIGEEVSVITSGTHNGTTWIKPLLLREAVEGSAAPEAPPQWNQGDVVRLMNQEHSMDNGLRGIVDEVGSQGCTVRLMNEGNRSRFFPWEMMERVGSGAGSSSASAHSGTRVAEPTTSGAEIISNDGTAESSDQVAAASSEELHIFSALTPSVFLPTELLVSATASEAVRARMLSDLHAMETSDEAVHGDYAVLKRFMRDVERSKEDSAGSTWISRTGD